MVITVESFLEKFVSLVEHLMQNSEKIQFIRSDDSSHVHHFNTLLTQSLTKKETLVLNIDMQSYLNQYESDYFLDWAADQFEEQLKNKPDQIDSPWLIVITQAHLLESKILAQLLTLKHQRKNAQLYLLFHVDRQTNLDQYLQDIDDDLIVQKHYHLHDLPDRKTESGLGLESSNIKIFSALALLVASGFFVLGPKVAVNTQKVNAHLNPVEQFTDNSLDNWSEQTQKELEKLSDQVVELTEHLDQNPEQLNEEQEAESRETITDQDENLNQETKVNLESNENLDTHIENNNQSEQQAQVEIELSDDLSDDQSNESVDLKTQDISSVQISEKLAGSQNASTLLSSQEKRWAWQLVAFNSLEKAKQFKQEHCDPSCHLAQNQEFYVVLWNEYTNYTHGQNDKIEAQRFTQNPWLRDISSLKEVSE